MKKFFTISLLAICCLQFAVSCYAQQNFGIGTPTPNAAAILDITSASKGVLFPRLTTAQRNAITAPIPESLLIYNTTTQCYEGYDAGISMWVAFGCIGTGCALPVPTGVTALPVPNPICAGSTLTLTGAATNATSWSWTGPNGFTSTLQNPTIPNITATAEGVYTLTAGNACGATASINTDSVFVSGNPTTANAGANINPPCGSNTTLAGNTPLVGTGTWSWVSGGTAPTIATPNSPTSIVSGLAVPGSTILKWTISNGACVSSANVTITTTTCSPTACTWNGATSFTVTHTVGDGVTPVTKTVTYGQTQTSLSGASKCWITQNLGADHAATSVYDATEPSAGWYWQFNLKQGYKAGSPSPSIPAWPATFTNEASDWLPANDPCTLLGAGWRLPTMTEWFNADANSCCGANWGSINDAYASVLKLHAGGYILGGTKYIVAGYGYFCSSTDFPGDGSVAWELLCGTYSGVNTGAKSIAVSVRCLK